VLLRDHHTFKIVVEGALFAWAAGLIILGILFQNSNRFARKNPQAVKRMQEIDDELSKKEGH